jgi:hypothetical protein
MSTSILPGNHVCRLSSLSEAVEDGQISGIYSLSNFKGAVISLGQLR